FPHEPPRILCDSALFANRSTALKIGGQPLAQRRRHADVDEPPAPIDHAINARARRATLADRTADICKVFTDIELFQAAAKRPERRATETAKRFHIRSQAFALHRLTSLFGAVIPSV